MFPHFPESPPSCSGTWASCEYLRDSSRSDTKIPEASHLEQVCHVAWGEAAQLPVNACDLEPLLGEFSLGAHRWAHCLLSLSSASQQAGPGAPWKGRCVDWSCQCLPPECPPGPPRGSPWGLLRGRALCLQSHGHSPTL